MKGNICEKKITVGKDIEWGRKWVEIKERKDMEKSASVENKEKKRTNLPYFPRAVKEDGKRMCVVLRGTERWKEVCMKKEKNQQM